LVAAAVATLALAVPSAAGAHQAILGRVALPCVALPGEGVAGARVFARLEGSRWIAAEERSDRNGRFRFDLPPGRYVVGARPGKGDAPQGAATTCGCDRTTSRASR
jgi:hypothetical protein